MINVALVGNPNTGKTTLYNLLTVSHEHVGNWHGVTVEEKAKLYNFKGQQIRMVDLPGVYSLSPLSYEEGVTIDYLLSKPVDLVVNICDASNLKRNLYLTLSLLEMGLPTLLVVNQIDKRPICKIDFALLEKLLGLKVVYINASSKKDGEEVNRQICKLYEKLKNGYGQSRPSYLKELRLDKVRGQLNNLSEKEMQFADFFAIKLFEDDEKVKEKFKIENEFGGVDAVAECRYRYIDEVLAKCCSVHERVYGQSKFDKILLNRFLAFPIFLLIISAAFYLTFFSVGAFLSDGLGFLLDRFIAAPTLRLLTNTFGRSSWIVSLFQDAIFGGVGSILSFLPQVALLFFFLSLLEDSGYLSRVAFVFEDILGKIGLSGKSVYTLLMGFGCSTTAVLTARNMEDKNSKIKTGLLTPYMSCSAKFPIYAVLGGAFFGASNIFVILGLYFLGVVVALLMSFIYEKTVLKSKAQSFILEFPPYRMMNFKRTMSLLWLNVGEFLTRVASLILAMNVIVWVLSNFTITFKFVSGGEQSMLETFGRIIAPIFKPLGFGQWGLVSALLAGLVAKEVIVSSIAMFNGVEEGSISGIGESVKDSSLPAFFASGSAVLSYLVFCLLYFPCLATASVLGKEIGKKWLFIGLLSEFIIAYITSFVVYRLGLAFEVYGWMAVLIFLASLAIILSSAVIVFKICKKGRCNCHGKCKKDCGKR